MPSIAHESREYERYDFNSLVAHEPANRAVMPTLMDGSSEFPSRAEMEAGMVEFVARAGLRVRYDTPWQGTSRDGEHYLLHTPDGPLSDADAIFSVGWPSRACPRRSGPIEHAAHYVDTRDAASYAGKRLFIVGKATPASSSPAASCQWASPIILASPRSAQLSVNLHSLDGVRARYVQPWEDAELGGGVFILNALDRADRETRRWPLGAHATDRYRRALRRRGRRGHRRDGLHGALARPRGLGVSTFGRTGIRHDQ